MEYGNHQYIDNFEMLLHVTLLQSTIRFYNSLAVLPIFKEVLNSNVRIKLRDHVPSTFLNAGRQQL